MSSIDDELSLIFNKLSLDFKRIEAKNAEVKVPDNVASMVEPAVASPRTKDKAAVNEAEDIRAIIRGLTTNNECGSKIKAAFKEKFNMEILDARERIGKSRGTHYDLEILIRPVESSSVGEWKTVEHKGSKDYTQINPADTPWAAGVQFHNGGCEKYTLARKYAKCWYNMYVGSESLKKEFNLSAQIPTFEDWFKNDAKVQADPKTLFGKELKKAVRLLRGPKASLPEKRSACHNVFDISEEDRQLLIQEVLPIANQALLEKDYWMTIHGDLTGDFYVAWYPQFTISRINDVIITKDLDINIQFICESGFNFKGILRWGKGAGFSNLRIDLK